MRVAVSFDHAGWPLRDTVLRAVLDAKHDIVDAGPPECVDGDDYPDRALEVANALVRNDALRGILVCGSGVGACVSANKVLGIRACLCHDTFSARQGVEDDDLNVLCLGARIIGSSLAAEVIASFLDAQFSDAARHRRRVDKVRALDERNEGVR